MRQHRKFVDIKSQSLFCEALMCRLNYDIQNSAEGSWSGMENHTQKQNDIVRLRRELLELSKMLEPWRKDG